MKHFIILATALSFSSSAALAEENVLVMQKPQKVIYEDSSEYNRMDKDYMFTVQPSGVNPTGAIGPALTVAKYLDRNSMIGMEVTDGSVLTFSFLSRYDINASSVGVYYKKFVGNSFYYRGGLDYRRADYKYEYDDIWGNPNDDVESTFIANSLAASIVIGNQWQWKGFTLGCDWIGYTQPFASNIEKEVEKGNFDDSDRRRKKDDIDFLTKRGVAQGLRLYLGASF